MNTEFVSLVPIPGKYFSNNSIIPPITHIKSNITNFFDKYLPRFSSNESSQNKLVIISVLPATVASYDKEKYIKGLAPIKNDQSPFSSFHCKAYRSGRRSAIVPCKETKNDNDWIIAYSTNGTKYTPSTFEDATDYIRLKGCGMWLEQDKVKLPGFTLQETQSCHYNGEDKIYEIRGCAFEDTAFTELYATKTISESLSKFNIACGNIPLGTWIYDPIQGDEAPLIHKNVIVMKTLGDKRLETHLLAGLEKLINEISDDKALEAANRIRSLYLKHGITKLGDEFKSFSKSSSINRNDMEKECTRLIGSTESGHFQKMSEIDLIKAGYVPSNELKEALNGINCRSFNLSSFVDLFSRIGYEAGRVLASIHRAGFLWGTFVDHNESELHCNAHPDNLIVLSKELAQKYHQLFAPVDFDMAFEAKCAINIWMNKPTPDPTIVTSNFSAEHDNLLKDIVGLAATFPGMSTAIQQRPQPTGNKLILLESLRDAASWEYIFSYIDPSVEKQFNIDELYPIISSALEYTNGIQS